MSKELHMVYWYDLCHMKENTCKQCRHRHCAENQFALDLGWQQTFESAVDYEECQKVYILIRHVWSVHCGLLLVMHDLLVSHNSVKSCQRHLGWSGSSHFVQRKWKRHNSIPKITIGVENLFDHSLPYVIIIAWRWVWE